MVLSPLLFLGDGQETIVDVAAAAVVLIVCFFAWFFLKKKRQTTGQRATLFWIFLGYLALRSGFSDDVGLSIYTLFRYTGAILLFLVFYEYSTEKTAGLFNRGLFVFGFFSLSAAIVITKTGTFHDIMPPMNLLYPNYGHNHVVDILLFAVPMAAQILFGIQKKMLWKITAVFLMFGFIFSFARAATVLASGYFIYLIFIKRPRFISARKIYYALLIMIVLTVFMLISPYTMSGHTQKSLFGISTIKAPVGQDNRILYAVQALKAISERPFFGSGPGTFALSSRRLQSDYNTNSWFSHNELLQTTAEIGLIGVFIICLIIYSWTKMRCRIVSGEAINKQKDMIKHALILVVIYSFIDYSLRYAVVLFLCAAALGAFLSIVTKVEKKEQATILNRIAIFGLAVLYISLVFSYIFELQNNDSAAFYSAPYRRKAAEQFIRSMEKNGLYLTDNQRRFLFIIYRNQPGIQAMLAREFERSHQYEKAVDNYLRAATLDPLNELYSKDFIRIITTHEDMRGFGKSTNFFIQTQPKILKKDTADNALMTKEQMRKIKTDLLIALSARQPLQRELASVYFYILGEAHLDTDPEQTYKYWLVARDLSPEWGHFHIELAALNKYILNREGEIRAILSDCLKSWLTDRCVIKNQLPQPGSLREYILTRLDN